jgi:hypothetical protein
LAAALCARAEKLPLATVPPEIRAVVDWIREAAVWVIGVDGAAGVEVFEVMVFLLRITCQKQHIAMVSDPDQTITTRRRRTFRIFAHAR